MERIAIVSSESGDWVGVYKDDVLLVQEHSIVALHLLQKLGYDVDCWTIPDQLAEVVDWNGSESKIRKLAGDYVWVNNDRD